MAVWKLTDKPRSKPWRAKVKGKVRDFVTKEDAELYEREELRSYTLTGLPLPKADVKMEVGDLLRRYIAEGGNGRKLSRKEIDLLTPILRDEPGKTLCSRPVTVVKKEHAYAFRAKRFEHLVRGEPISKHSVRREFALLHAAWEVGREEYGLEFLSSINPFKVKWRGLLKGGKRKRRLIDGEFERLIAACDDCLGLNRYFYPLVITIAVETGMRLSEIFNLTWENINFKTRRIEIEESKTDKTREVAGRTIVLPYPMIFRINSLKKQLPGLKLKGPIFPPTRNGNPKHSAGDEACDAYEQTWSKTIRVRAKVVELHPQNKQLHFHDLRHEAASRFDEASLTENQRNHMMGHDDGSQGSVYAHAELNRMQEKLDTYYSERLARRIEAKANKRVKADPRVIEMLRVMKEEQARRSEREASPAWQEAQRRYEQPTEEEPTEPGLRRRTLEEFRRWQGSL